MIRGALLMLAKDLRLFVRDPIALGLAVALPILLVTVFGAIMGNLGGGGGGMPAVDVVLVDFDGSAASRAFVASLADNAGVDLDIVEAEREPTLEHLQSLVSGGATPFVLLLPEGFGEGADLQLLRDPGRSLDMTMLSFALIPALLEARGEDVFWDIQRRALREAGIPGGWRARIEAFTLHCRLAMEGVIREADEAGLLHPPGGAAADDGELDMGAVMTSMLPLIAQDVAPDGRDKQLGYQLAMAVSGMTVMMLMFSLVGYARTLIEERDQGTLNRLFLAPVDQRAVLFAKFLGTFVMGLVLTAVLFAWAALLFGLEIASRWDTLVVVSVFTSAAVTGFALLIASAARTDKQADGLSVIVILVMSAIGGSWMPLNMMPEAIQRLARGTLTFWSMDGYLASFWYDRHWTDAVVLDHLAVLAGIALLLSLLAAWIFRRRYLPG